MRRQLCRQCKCPRVSCELGFSLLDVADIVGAGAARVRHSAQILGWRDGKSGVGIIPGRGIF